jgi:hypothetical protein
VRIRGERGIENRAIAMVRGEGIGGSLERSGSAV